MSMQDKPLFVTPGCCKASGSTPVVFLKIPSDFWRKERSFDEIKVFKPTWCAYFYDSAIALHQTVTVDNCPFCGKKLPEIDLVKRRGKVSVIIDGGYYCDTCKERLCNCKCLPMEFFWGPVHKL